MEVVGDSPHAGRVIAAPRMRPIGGEFEIAPRLLGIWEHQPSTTCSAFATGRAALRAVLAMLAEAAPRTKVLLPDYLCASMIQAVESLGLPFGFFSVDRQLHVDVANLLTAVQDEGPGGVVVVLVDYFGLDTCAEALRALKAAHPETRVVRDNSQALFACAAEDGIDYSFTNLRKWLPTPDGAFITSGGGAIPCPSDCEAEFVSHKIVGNLVKGFASAAGMTDRSYLDHTERGERLLERGAVVSARMSGASRTILGNIDLAEVATRRRRNFVYLRDAIADMGLRPIVPLHDHSVPLALPICVEERDQVRRVLAESRVFCPVHWPMPASLRGATGHELWESELSLVIDQRYEPHDLDRIVAGLRVAGARPYRIR